MIFIIPDTGFFLNYIMDAGTYRAEARKIHGLVQTQNGFARRYVVLRSVSEEFERSLLGFSEVLEKIIGPSSGTPFDAREICKDAEFKGLYYRHRDMLEMLKKVISREPGFDTHSKEALLELAGKQTRSLRNSFTNTFTGRRVQFYEPPEEVGQKARAEVDFSVIPKHDRENVFQSYCFANHKYRKHVDHGFVFLTFDWDLADRATNYQGRLGKLSIMHHSFFTMTRQKATAFRPWMNGEE